MTADNIHSVRRHSGQFGARSGPSGTVTATLDAIRARHRARTSKPAIRRQAGPRVLVEGAGPSARVDRDHGAPARRSPGDSVAAPDRAGRRGVPDRRRATGGPGGPKGAGHRADLVAFYRRKNRFYRRKNGCSTVAKCAGRKTRANRGICAGQSRYGARFYRRKMRCNYQRDPYGSLSGFKTRGGG